MPPRKLLLYTHALEGGGAERVFATLASGLAARGHTVLLAVDVEAEANRAYLSPDVRLIVLGRQHGQSVLRLARLLAQEKPDISLSGLSVSNLKHVLAAMLALRLRHSILSYHGFYKNEPQLLSQISYRLTPLLTRLTARTICVSLGLQDYLKTHFFTPARRMTMIYNPVVTGPLSPAATRQELLERPPVLLAIGRFAPSKNLPLLIRAFAHMKHRETRLIILGEGPERGKIEAEIKRQGIEDRVSLPGYALEPWPYYAQARCFALTSNSETFSLVIVEALANGLAVVSTNCDGPREILDRGRYGWIVPQGDEKALTLALDALFDDPGDPAPRIERAKAFTVEKAVAAYENLFEEVLAEG
jgi:glycosyltransferase involved in cell wall biosynthesis